MTACSTNTCGVGGWDGPLPGDPDNNSALHARGTFGGIDVTWTLPATNPHAVAFTRIWRGVLPDFNAAIIIAEVGGNTYYDKNTSTLDTYYYYWIQFVSINGTVFDPIGPDAALSRPAIANVITGLSAQIDDGFLASSLKSTIDSIGTNYTAFLKEVQDRHTATDTLAASIALLQTSVSETMTFVNEEIVNRQEGDSALVAELNTVAVANGENIAAVQTTLQADIDLINGELVSIGALYTAKVTVNGLIGGFGVYNDGTEVQAGFDVDKFWVGRTNLDKKKPFIIQDDEVFINQAVIANASIDAAKIDTATIQNLSAFSADMGTLTAGKIKFEQQGAPSNYMTIDAATQSLRVYNNGVLRVKIGNLA